MVVVERCRVVEFACAVLFYGTHRERERDINWTDLWEGGNDTPA